MRHFYFLIFFCFAIVLSSSSQTNLPSAWMSGDNVWSQTGVYGTKGVPSTLNKPGSRMSAITWTDAGGNLWLFGGYGYSSNSYGALNDLWKFNPLTGEWTWVAGDNISDQRSIYGEKGVASKQNKPGSRHESIAWSDSFGNFWLMGGSGFTENSAGYLNDVWKFDPSMSEWTWISGDSVSNQTGIYGEKGVPGKENKPGGRFFSVSWTDSSGNFWLMGGTGYPSYNFVGLLNDLWKFNPTSGEWTWVSGDDNLHRWGRYGTKGVAETTNAPGSRDDAVSWTDTSGNLWLMGGYGGASNGFGYLNDLWKFNTSTNEWTWMSGDDIANQAGIYGLKGVPDIANKPSARSKAISWTDISGNLWLMAGLGHGNGTEGRLNDLWRFDIASKEWTWMSGDSTLEQAGVYGTKGISTEANKPACRQDAFSWGDQFGNFWLMGGFGFLGFGYGPLNDLWKFTNYTFYKDSDKDGFGDLKNSIQSFSSTIPIGYVLNNTDCNDNDASVYQNAEEVCDGKDNNCDGIIDNGLQSTYYRDNDKDGYGIAADVIQSCKAVDGYVPKAGDCDDNDARIYPGSAEKCGNNKDDNCNGTVDENCGSLTIKSEALIAYESDRTVKVTVYLSQKSTKDIKIDYETLDGSAKAHKDFKFKKGQLVIPAGKLSASVTIDILSDNLVESEEYFRVRFYFWPKGEVNETFAVVGIVDCSEKGKQSLQLNVAPNPSKTSFILVWNSLGKEKVTMVILDEVGKVKEIRSNLPASGTLSIGQNFVPGVYFVMVNQGRKVKIVKLIKQP